MSSLKGQSTLEYLLSFSLFIAIVIYIYLMYMANVPKFVETAKIENIRSKSFQLSQHLISDVGYPADWYIYADDLIKRIGLSDQNYNQQNMLSKLKIDRLQQVCGGEGYGKVQNWLALNQSFSIYISDIDPNTGIRTPMASCSPPIPARGVVNVTIQRIVAYNDGGNTKVGEILIQV